MLFLPKGVSIWYQEECLRKETNLGKMLIEVACLHAWNNGFKCEHPMSMNKFIRLEKIPATKDQNAKVLRHEKCSVCGMISVKDVSKGIGSDFQRELKYPIAGIVEQDLVSINE